jgi:4-hydroxyproline epimerase
MAQGRRVRVVDSHTGGEPTRVVVEGGPDLGAGTMAEALCVFKSRHDKFRTAMVKEPRGFDAVVGAMLCAPSDPTCRAGVIFFNNVGYLGMCGHGTIGLVVTLAHLGRAEPGAIRIETPVGVVTADLHGPNEVTINNVASYRLAKDVSVDVEGYGTLHGDIAWGGNWFFLVNDHGQDLELANLDALMDCTRRIRQGLDREGITGEGGGVIDHIELNGPSKSEGVDGKNFVLCPGLEYDRSPCGTGTSAKLACLYADGLMKPGDAWRQESIVGSVFTGSFDVEGDRVLPRIRGSAYVTAETTLIINDDDPFGEGIAP